jgi:hypothetical protein
MKYVKMLGLLVVAAVASMSFTSSASALITNPAGTKATEILTSKTFTTLHGSVTIECEVHKEFYIVAGGTVIPVLTTSFTNCGTDTVNTVSNGSLNIASNGEVTSTGAEWTAVTHRTVLGFPVTAHCIYKTNNTKVGTLTEGVNPAVIHIGSSPIPRVATDSACGETSVMTGAETLSPAGAIVVD